MKFNQKTKDKIDNYFNNITENQLYEKLTKEYGLKELNFFQSIWFKLFPRKHKYK